MNPCKYPKVPPPLIEHISPGWHIQVFSGNRTLYKFIVTEVLRKDHTVTMILDGGSPEHPNSHSGLVDTLHDFCERFTRLKWMHIDFFDDGGRLFCVVD